MGSTTMTTTHPTRTLAPDEVRLHFTKHMEEPAEGCRVCLSDRAQHRFLARIDAQRVLDMAREEGRVREASDFLRRLTSQSE